MLSLQLVRVAGPSMVPTVRDGDVVLVVRGARVRAGDLVLARFRSMPERSVLKRAVQPQNAGWLVASDNPFAGGDSAVHGVADVLGRAVLRWPRGRPGLPGPLRRQR